MDLREIGWVVGTALLWIRIGIYWRAIVNTVMGLRVL
jgi:hypothetical protein